MKSKKHIKRHTNNISRHTRLSTFANHTSRHAAQSLQKSLPFTHADKIELKKISSPSENKKYAYAQPETDRQKSKQTLILKLKTDNGLQERTDRTPAANITYTQAGVSCFVGQESGIFEVQSFVGSSVVKCPACV